MCDLLLFEHILDEEEALRHLISQTMFQDMVLLYTLLPIKIAYLNPKF